MLVPQTVWTTEPMQIMLKLKNHDFIADQTADLTQGWCYFKTKGNQNQVLTSHVPLPKQILSDSPLGHSETKN